jgi:2-methylcitrate dehydratase PrpD
VSKTTSAPGVTAALARRAAQTRDDPSQSLRRRVRHSLLDWLGVTLAGSREDAGRIAAEVALLEREAPRSTLVGTPHRAGPQSAAFVNGTAAHALDYDDSSFWMTGHPSAPILAAALAVGEARRTPPRTIAAAVLAGHDVAARLGVAAGKEHYLRGWHATGTIGAFAAAAAAGRAIELDEEAMARAFGLAATQAAGLKTSFGTMAKPLHAGRAAANGVLAALLAEQGFTAGAAGVEGHQGFAATQAPGFDPGRVAAEIGERAGIEGVLYKQHACCGGTHGAIDALRRLLAEHPVQPGDVERVEVLVSDQMFDICCIPEPRVGIEGKFSLRHVAALVLAGRSTGPSGFTDEAVADPELLDLRGRVEIRSSGAPTGLETTAVLVLRSGEALQLDSRPRRAATDDELDGEWEALAAKTTELATPVLGADVAAELVDRVASFEQLDDVGDVTELTRTAR